MNSTERTWSLFEVDRVQSSIDYIEEHACELPNDQAIEPQILTWGASVDGGRPKSGKETNGELIWSFKGRKGTPIKAQTQIRRVS